MKSIGIALFVGVVAGWIVHGWHADSVSLAVAEAAQAIRDDAVGRESNIAKEVSEGMQRSAVVERVIDRGVIREIQKPIYQRVCFEPELVRLLNDGAKGRPVARGESSKPSGGVP